MNRPQGTTRHSRAPEPGIFQYLRMIVITLIRGLMAVLVSIVMLSLYLTGLLDACGMIPRGEWNTAEGPVVILAFTSLILAGWLGFLRRVWSWPGFPLLAGVPRLLVALNCGVAAGLLPSVSLQSEEWLSLLTAFFIHSLVIYWVGGHFRERTTEPDVSP